MPVTREERRQRNAVRTLTTREIKAAGDYLCRKLTQAERALVTAEGVMTDASRVRALVSDIPANAERRAALAVTVRWATETRDHWKRVSNTILWLLDGLGPQWKELSRGQSSAS